MIDTELYRVFHIVAQCGTVSGAAGKLHVSQPAVSKSIKKLEELTGCTLFIRSSQGVRMTPEGRILFDYVALGLEHLQNGERILKKVRDRGQGLVRVGISSTLCRYYFLPHLERFHRNYPGIRIAVVNRTSPETLALLDKGVIDFGIISIPKDRSRHIFHELMPVRDVFVAGPDYPSPCGPLPLAALASHPLMLLEKDNVTRSLVNDFLAEYNVELQPEIEIGSMDFLIEFAKIGLGIALVIKSFIEDDLACGRLQEIETIPAMPERSIGIVRPKNLPLSIAAEAFIESLRR